MNSVTLNPAPSPAFLSFPALWGDLLARQRMLAVYGAVMLALTVPALIAQTIDPRMIDGVNIWVKPAKFFASIGVFALTMAWFHGLVRPERRTSRLLRGNAWLLIASSLFEIAYICWQAALGQASHFNISTPFHIVMYALMGMGATLLVATTLPLAWEVARRPAASMRPDFVAAVVIGLVLTFALGGGLGGYMSSQLGHSVGAEGGHVPVVGWNRLGGDLRVAHFLGIHAQQAIPLLAAMVAGAPPRLRWTALAAGTLLYIALTLALFAQAVAGQPLLPA